MPINGGGRLTGRVGRYSSALLNIQTGDEPSARAPATNFSVVRVKRDVLRAKQHRRAVHGPIGRRRRGAGRTRRTASTGPSRSSTTSPQHLLGADRTRRRCRATTRATARSSTTRATATALQLEHLAVGDIQSRGRLRAARRHAPELRAGALQSAARGPAGTSASLLGRRGAYIENGAGRLETRDVDGEFGDRVPQQRPVRRSAYIGPVRVPAAPFRIAPGRQLPVGGYDFGTARVGYTLGTAAARVRAAVRSSTALLQRRPDRVASPRGRVERRRRSSRWSRRVGQLGGSSARAVHDRAWSARASPTR